MIMGKDCGDTTLWIQSLPADGLYVAWHLCLAGFLLTYGPSYTIETHAIYSRYA